MIYLTNAFSLNMMINDNGRTVVVEPIAGSLAAQILYHEGFESAVGHADTAAVFSDVLGFTVKANRVSLALDRGAHVIVGQYIGPRLAEGAYELPEGAKIEWFEVRIA